MIGLGLFAAAACDRPLTASVDNDRMLQERVMRAVPVGTDTGAARATMTRNGFACVFRTGLQVDTLASDDVAPPLDRFTCIRDDPAPETSDGYRRNLADVLLDGGVVTRIEARSRIDRVR
ncbi:MAG: hypothetical protein JWM95_1257 [Gemmatimonadetes bacterium]|nr:hypothetical protein [Gemmatimonadota bacterium]